MDLFSFIAGFATALLILVILGLVAVWILSREDDPPSDQRPRPYASNGQLKSGPPEDRR
jgi:hypothetical protein